jgi:hypothetical protein
MTVDRASPPASFTREGRVFLSVLAFTIGSIAEATSSPDEGDVQIMKRSMPYNTWNVN